MKEIILVYDYDAIAFRAAAAAQKKTIEAMHKSTGEILTFKSRKELWGDWRKKIGGWIGEQNKESLKYTWEDFDITDKVEPEPVENAIQIVKSLILNCNKDMKATGYYGYIGGASNFRVERSTLIKYKGQRDDLDKPVHLEAIKGYIRVHHAGETAVGVEADDLVAADVYDGWKAKDPNRLVIGVGLDKDYKGCEGTWWNFVNKKLLKVQGLGELWQDGSDVDGYGRLFKYWQICYGDGADNYYAAAASNEPNGEITAMKALAGSKTDKEAWENIAKHFKRLYPEPIEITGWRGDKIKIDWLYVLQEMTDLAHMQRFPGDKLDVVQIMQKLGVQHE